MAYNRWLSPDELMHHGVIDQKWGVKNGPPYPLSRQKRFRTIGPDGRPITSKVAYKKAMKVQRAKSRAERRVHPDGTEQDKKERSSVFARAKRKYRGLDKKWREENAREEAEEKARQEKEASDWEAAKKRLEESNIPKEEAEKLLSKVTYKDLLKGQHWGTRNVDKNEIEYDDDEDLSKAERLNNLIDQYEGKREDAKTHGTIAEVMKFRDTFSADDWKSIANRLEAEATVSKFLSNATDNGTSASLIPTDEKLKKIYLKGTAKEVYERRSDFSVDQLNAISKRLEAENKIGQYADKQVELPSDAYQKLSKLSDFLSIGAKSAESISKIVKAFGGSSSGGGGGGKQTISGANDKNESKGGKVKNQSGGNSQKNQKDQKDPSTDIARVIKAIQTLSAASNKTNKALNDINKSLNKKK